MADKKGLTKEDKNEIMRRLKDLAKGADYGFEKAKKEFNAHLNGTALSVFSDPKARAFKALNIMAAKLSRAANMKGKKFKVYLVHKSVPINIKNKPNADKEFDFWKISGYGLARSESDKKWYVSTVQTTASTKEEVEDQFNIELAQTYEVNLTGLRDKKMYELKVASKAQWKECNQKTPTFEQILLKTFPTVAIKDAAKNLSNENDKNDLKILVGNMSFPGPMHAKGISTRAGIMESGESFNDTQGKKISCFVDDDQIEGLDVGSEIMVCGRLRKGKMNSDGTRRYPPSVSVIFTIHSIPLYREGYAGNGEEEEEEEYDDDDDVINAEEL